MDSESSPRLHPLRKKERVNAPQVWNPLSHDTAILRPARFDMKDERGNQGRERHLSF